MIELNNVSKKINNNNIVSNITFNIRNNEIIGLLGLNGSGKTTILKMLSGFLPVTNGTIHIYGYDIHRSPELVKPYIAYLPENNPLYYDMNVYEFLTFIATLYNIPKNIIKKRILKIVEKCFLLDKINEKIGVLSKGYKQRVGLAHCLIHKPKILILDEPTSSLDLSHSTEIRKIVKEASKNMAIIFSSHILADIESVCDNIIILDHGQIKFNSKINDFSFSYKEGSTIKKKSTNQEINWKKYNSFIEKILIDKSYNTSHIQLAEKFGPLTIKCSNKIKKEIFLKIPEVESVEFKDDKYILYPKNNNDIRTITYKFIKHTELELLELYQKIY